jgi:hypothetical protein
LPGKSTSMVRTRRNAEYENEYRVAEYEYEKKR